MKNLSYLFVIFTAGLLFSCKSQSGDELLLQGIMKNRMNDLKYSKYTENKNDDTVTFEVADKEFRLRGNYSQVADYKVVSLYQADNESGEYLYLTAIFANEGGIWQSVFEKELEPGILDTIIDLNKDKVNEIVLQYYERNMDEYESRLGLYARKGSLKYAKIGDIAPSYFRGSAYNNGFSTVELLQVNDYSLLFVNTQESDPLENNLGNKKNSGFFYRVTTAGILEKLNADELVLTRDPLLFKYQKNGLWGIYSRVGNGIVEKKSRYLAGPVDLLSGLSKTKEILPAEYIEILAPSEGLIPVQNKNHLAWGVINLNGDFVVNCKYNGLSKFENGRAVVQIRGEEDWRKAYQYIDTKGNELGSFFDKNTTNDTIRSEIVLSSNSDRTLFQRVSLENYPGGAMYCGAFGYSLGQDNEECYTFYPNASFGKIIAEYAKKKSDYSAMIRKFDGNPFEYTEGGITFSSRVQKADNGTISVVLFFKSEGDEVLSFEVKDNGVMVKKSYERDPSRH